MAEGTQDYRRSLLGKDASPSPCINLREDFHNLLYGTDDRPGIGWPVMIWRAILTQRAAGWNLRSNNYDEPQIMKNQLKSGFIHENVFVRAYRSYNRGEADTVPWGRIFVDGINYYTEHNVFPNRQTALLSELWEIEHDPQTNKITRPVVRLERYRIKHAEMMREHGGLIQFWKLTMEKQEI
jgi:hypothetical protein